MDCSGGVCQKEHWEDGHKQECRAPDPPSSGSSVASSRNISDVFSRSSSTSESRTLSDVSDFQGSEDTNHHELSRPALSVTANGALSKPKKVMLQSSLLSELYIQMLTIFALALDGVHNALDIGM